MIKAVGRIDSAWILRASGFLVILMLIASFALVPLVSPYAVDELVARPMQPPSAAHLFGTDTVGRDIFVRVFTAGRIDLAMAVLATAICFVIGNTLGMVIGTSPATLRVAMLRFVDAILAIPSLILIIGVVMLLAERQILPFVRPSITALVVGLVITGWTSYARVTAAQTRVVITRESVVAARVLGYGRVRTMLRHVAPIAIRPTLALAASQVVATTGAIASLAFLGIGVAPPTPSLGQMLQDGIGLISSAWWISTFPGLMVFAIGVGFTLIAESMRR